MRILNLQVSNLLKLVALDITPVGNTVVISGKNGAGKTSGLNAIAYALGGTKLVPDQPIHKGALKASITLKLGDKGVVEYEIVRRFTAKGSTISVKRADGTEIEKPQAMLNELLSAVTFDPLKFSREAPKAQRDMLVEFLGLDKQLAELDGKFERLYASRTEVGRERKAAEGRLSGYDDTVLAKAPAEPVVLAELMEQLTNAQAAHSAHDALKLSVVRAYDEMVRCTGQVKAAEQALAAAKHALADATSQHEQLKASAEAVAGLPDIEAIKHRMAEAEALNNAHRLKQAHKLEMDEYRKLDTNYENITAELKAIELAKADAIASAPMPVPGLSFDGDNVLYKGVPFNQASGAERVLVSTAMAIAANPKLRVALLDEVDVLDDESRAALDALAVEHDFDLWMTSVRGGAGSIVIEDGMVKEAASGTPNG